MLQSPPRVKNPRPCRERGSVQQWHAPDGHPHESRAAAGDACSLAMMKVVASTMLVVFSVIPAYSVDTSIWRTDPKILNCSPGKLSAEGMVRLHLAPRHGSELAIRRESDGIWYMLVVQAPPPAMKSLMSRAQFARAQEVTISVATTGYRWTVGGGNEKIFTSVGHYSVHVSEALESERGGYMCRVSYSGHRNAR